MAGLFTFLYPLVTIISLLAYVPQVKSLIHIKKSPDNISLSSWLMWFLSSALSLGYGVFHLKDFMFVLTTGVGLFFIAIVIGLVAYKRCVYGTLSLPFMRFTKVV